MSRKKIVLNDAAENAGLTVADFTAYLKRLNPDAFQHVTHEFMEGAVESFPDAHATHAAKVAEFEAAKEKALAENRNERQKIADDQRNAARKRIEDARQSVANEEARIAENQRQLLEAQQLAQNPE